MDQHLPDWAFQMNSLGAQRIPFFFLLDFDLQIPVVLPLTELSSECIKFEINAVQSSVITTQTSVEKLTLKSFPVDYPEYENRFNKVREAIQRGDTYLLNLCFATRMEDVPELSYIYEQARAPYKLLFGDSFVVFSPERFVAIEDGRIKTFPMKGTMDASIPDAEQILLHDVKEQEEHATVVDLLRNDLSIVARNVGVRQYRYLSRIYSAGKTLLQCSSEIEGVLHPEFHAHLGEVFLSILPAGSVTGAPKKRTVELIREIEPVTRGYYTGVFGVYDGKDLDSAVLIRMIERRPDGYYYRSGGGITSKSDPLREYHEMIDKIYIPV